MNVNDHIRRRREERIHTILREQARKAEAEKERFDHQPLQPIHEVAGPLDDPEYIWKLKQQQWQEDLGDPKATQGFGVYFMQHFRLQLGICLLVFTLVWGMFQLEFEWAKRGQTLIERSLTEDLQFEVIANWYDNVFQGTPSFIPTYNKERNSEKVDAID